MRLKTLHGKFERLGSEEGSVLIGIIIIFAACALIAGVIFTSVNSDLKFTAQNLQQQEAYYAATVGANDYSYRLNQDVNYWQYCASPPSSEADPALNANVGQTANQAQVADSTVESYAIQMVPASSAPSGDKKCDKSNPLGTMIEEGGFANGTFRVLVTGYAGGAQSSIMVTYQAQSFLNYIYYSKFETPDPVTYANPSQSPVPALCDQPYGTRPSGCGNISFITGDTVSGPMYSADSVSICGSPTFGRSALDSIEFLGGTHANSSGCADTPNYVGTEVPPADVPTILPPSTDFNLLSYAQTNPYHLVGRTVILLDTPAQCSSAGISGPCLTLTNSCTTGDTCLNGGQPDTVAYPSNGLIFVSNGSCGITYTPYNPTYSGDGGCGNAYVSGYYTSSLTIATENDIVINGNITTAVDLSGVPTTAATLGLIADNFVRIYHPCSGGTNASDAISNPTIYAAILATNHSFIVDNFNCGAPLGTLTVQGSVEQIYRGTVGTFGSSSTGYLKHYVYDQRLQTDPPPYFISPVDATWHIYRQVVSFGG